MIIAVVGVLLIAGIGGAIFLMSGDDGNDRSENDGSSATTFVDAAGRTVQVPENLDRGIVTFGSSGPVRFLTVFDVFDKIVEVDRNDAISAKYGRGFSYAYDFSETPYHTPNKLVAADVEKVGVTVKPSLIILQGSLYESYNDLAKILEAIPDCSMMVLYNQQSKYLFDENNKVADYYRNNIEMIGKAIKMEARAAEHLQALEDIYSDIRSLIGTNPGVTYVAGMTASGSNEWTTTFPVYLPLELTKGQNAYTKPSATTRVDLNPEDAMTAIRGCDRILIDPSSSDKMSTQNSQLIMKGVYEINNDSDAGNDIDLFVTYPIIWSSMNYDSMLASTYYLLYLQYGTITLPEVKERIVDVFEAFYGERGTSVPISMGNFFLGKCSSNGVELPMLQPVKIVLKGDRYVTQAL